MFREGKSIYLYFYQKWIGLGAKNRMLKADLFAFDRDTHPYDFKLVGGKRLVSFIRSGFFFVI